MKTLLGIPAHKIDSSKYIKQLRSVITWIRNGARGTIVAATGIGKTFMAFIAIAKLKKKKPNATAIVIVPTLALKNQWERQITSLKLQNVDVFVINTIALKDSAYEYDLLILDELHLYASEQFRTVFIKIKYKWILGLTATIERLDGKHNLLQKRAPVVVTITQMEAIRNGWISNVVEINVPVHLSKREIEGLEALNKSVSYYLSKFGDFKAMQYCMNLENAKQYALSHYHDGYEASELVKMAIQGQRVIQARKAFLYNAERKVDIAAELVNEFDLKTIMFSQSTQFADDVSAKLPNSVVYHSNIESEARLVTKSKVYKTEAAALRFKATKDKAKMKHSSDGYTVTWKQPKIFGGKTLRDEALRLFKDRRSKINTICTAKALDQGFDAADIELGIDASRTSNPGQHVQRFGRIARNFTYKNGTKKRGILVNLYVPNSTDERWLRNCQVNTEDSVIWSSSAKECIEFIKELLS